MRIFGLFTIITICTFNIFGQNRRALNIIPEPVSVIEHGGHYTLTRTCKINYTSDKTINIAEYLSNKLNTSTGFKAKIQQGKSGDINLVINESPIPELGKEGYTLEVQSNKVIIKANQPAGLFYGIQTLLQLLPPQIESDTVTNTSWAIPLVSITDYPQFSYRGLMMDVSRHFYTKEEVKRFIDEISRYKFNTFHWHLTDDNGWRIEIKKWPLLTSVGAWRVERQGQFGERELAKPGEKASYGGFYTQEDIKEVVQYAQERYISIIPEVDVPGHSMAAIAAYPELCCTKDSSITVNPGTRFAEWFADGTFKMNMDNTLNPSDEKVYQFLDDVFTEVASMFPGKYIHVGGDECYHGYWSANEGCKALMTANNIEKTEGLQGYFVKKIEKIIATKGKTMLGWDEIRDAGVTTNAAIMCWRNPKIGYDAAHEGYKVIMSPAEYSYLDYYQGETTIEPPVYAGLRLSKCYNLNIANDSISKTNILGGQGNLWTEVIPNFKQVEYMLYPRAFALSEVYWTPKEKRDWKTFVDKAEQHFNRLQASKTNYSTAMYDPIIRTDSVNGSLVVSMQAEANNVDIFYSTDGCMPGIYSLKYSGPFKLPKGNITLRVITYRNNIPLGRLITLNNYQLENHH